MYIWQTEFGTLRVLNKRQTMGRHTTVIGHIRTRSCCIKRNKIENQNTKRNAQRMYWKPISPVQMCHIWIMSVNPMWWRFGTLFRTWNWNVSAFGNVQRKPWTMGHLRSFNTMYIWQLLKTCCIDSNTQWHNGNFIILVNESQFHENCPS